MTKHETYEKETEERILPILEEMGLTLVDTEYVKEAGSFYLRIYIDREGGVSIDDCEAVSKAFAEILDREEYIDEAYTLEVSSPGLGRALKKEKDYVRNLGKEIELRLFKAENKVKDFQGTLLSWTEESVTIREGKNEFTFDKKNIAMIREYVDWNAEK